MKPSEAIKIIKGLIRIAELGYNSSPLSKEGEHTATEALTLAISTLEKQEADRWHSVAKEGKPKESGTYIWTCDDGTHRKLVTVAKYFKRTGECKLTGARSYWKAKAWKPLPEPYEEEKNNDDVD